jgi:phosphoribosylformylglycinamidine synthase I
MTAAPILIPHASGTNRDGDAALAVSLAGGDPRTIHIRELASGRVRILDHAGILLPGGFSYGDALGAGARLALELREWFADELAETVRAGRPILGICNGFQALVRSGLLAGPHGAGGERRVTLTANECGRFECRWVTLRVETGCRSSWLEPAGELIRCPVAHGEGRLAVAGPEVEHELDENGLVAFRYVTEDGRPAEGAYPLNPNGSVGDIAGISDDSGLVVGLMPHPEDHVLDWQHPGGPTPATGLALFEAFVKAAR